MSELVMESNRVDLYVKGQLNAEETVAFEADLLESPRLQQAVEDVLSLQHVLDIEQQLIEAGVVDETAEDTPGWRQLPGVRQWSMAASMILAAGAVVLLWRSEVHNEHLRSQISTLNQPVGRVLTIPLDIMRSAHSSTPDVRIRKMPDPALLVLDVEVTAQMSNSKVLELELFNGKSDELASWSANPAQNGRIQIAFRSDHLPNGLLSLKISDPGSGTSETRLLELLPAEQ